MPRQIPLRARTVLLALTGAAVFWLANLPLPFLFGPLAACLIAALAGVRMAALGPLAAAARTILGVAVGASITPDLVQVLPQMALSVALIPLYVALIGLVGVPFFRRVCGFDPVTAYYAAMPGGLQDMVLFGQEAGGNVRTLSLVHATRLLLVVTVVPVILTQGFGVSLSNPIGVPAATIPLQELALMGIAAWVGWKGAARIGLFGASILGPLIVTAVLSLAGLIHTRPPAEAILTAQVFIGTGIGVFYVGITWRELRQVVASGVAFVGLLAVLAAIFSTAVVWLGLAAPVNAFLAFAPGGQAEMTVLAIVAGADLGFVIVHHLTRIVVVITGAPIAARLCGVRPSGR